MTRTSPLTLTILAILSLLGFALPSRAEDPQITVQISAPEINVDQMLMLVINVTRHDQPIGELDPVFDSSDDFDFSQGSVSNGSQTSARLEGNRAVRTVRYVASVQYSLTPRRTGTLTIPPATIEIDGQQYRTNPLQVSVTTPPVADFASISLLPGDVVAYEGQAIPMRLSWEINRNIEEGRMIGDGAPDGAEIFTMPPSDAANQSGTSIRFMGKSIGAIVSTGVGGSGIKVNAPFRIIFDRPGVHTLGPVGLVFSAIQGASLKRFSSTSEPVSVDIRPLPSKGRPDSFRGMVGACEIESSLSTPTMRVGDPVTLTVRIRGELPPSRIPAPPIQLQQNLTDAFRLASSGWVDAGEQGEWRVYSMMVRPQNAEMKEVPPVEVSYFDPASATYQVARSRPIPIAVEASRSVTAADAIGSGPRSVAAETLADAESGIRANQTSEDRLSKESFGLDARLAAPVSRVILIGAPIAWVSVAAITLAMRRRTPAARRRDRLLRSALRLARSSDPQKQARAARAFVAAHTDLDSEAVTTLDAEALLSEVESDRAPVVLHAMRSREAAEFGRLETTPSASTDLGSAIRTLSRLLETRA